MTTTTSGTMTITKTTPKTSMSLTVNAAEITTKTKQNGPGLSMDWDDSVGSNLRGPRHDDAFKTIARNEG